MSRNRIAVVVGVLVAFVIVGGILVYLPTAVAGTNMTFNVTVTGGKTMSLSTLSAHQNDSVTINVTSDTDGEVHLHGYDLIFNPKKGQTVSKTFTADKTGTYPIEWESTSTELGQLVVSP